MADPFDPMPPDPFSAPQKKSGFLSFLDFMDEFSQVPKNLIRGNLGATARHTANILGNAIDSVLPGDLIPEIAKPEDYVSSADLVGVDEKEHPFIAGATNFVGDTLLNPLTYLLPGEGAAAAAARKAAMEVGEGGVKLAGNALASATRAAADQSAKGLRFGIPFTEVSTPVIFGDKTLDPLALAGQGIRKAVSMLPPGGQKYVNQAALAAKDTLGWLNPIEPVKRAIAAAGSLRSRSVKAGATAAEQAMGSLPVNLQVLAGDVIDNLIHGDDGVKLLKGDFGRRTGAIEDIDQQIATLKARLPEHPDFQALPPEQQAQMGDAIEKAIRLGHVQYLDDLKHGALARPMQYTDEAGKTYMKDELEEMYLQEKRIADQALNRGARLDAQVHDLDVESKLANKLANQKAGQVDRRVQTQGGPTMAKALGDAGEPVAWLKDGTPIEMDPMFPRLHGELRDVEQVPIDRKDLAEITDGDKVIWSKKPDVPRKFGPETGPTDQLRTEFKGEFKRDQKLAGDQADVAWGLQSINPGEFEDFVRGRGLKVSPVDVSNASPRNYLARSFTYPEDIEAAALGPNRSKEFSNPQKNRKIRTDEDLVNTLNDPEMKGVEYERNAYKRLLSRSDAQGRMLQKASIAKHVLGDRFENLVDGIYTPAGNGAAASHQSIKSAMDETLNAMAEADPETARALSNVYNGMQARGPVMDVLAKANKFFKPAAVYGVVLPKMGSIVRNDLGTTWQALTTQGVGAAAKNLSRMPRRMFDSINDGLVKAFGWKHIAPGDMTRDFQLIEDAYKAAGGKADGVLDHLHKFGRDDLAAAVEHGVLDGFVSTEDMVRKSAGSPWWKQKAFDLYHAPASIFQGVEQRARLGNFLDQFKAGVNPSEAAAATREAMLDYSITSGKNRGLRDLIPFAAFMVGSVKQQGKFLSRNPSAAVALSNVYGQDPGAPVTPWLQEQARIGIGQDSNGDQTYLTGLGLPVEALNKIPNPLGMGSIPDLGRDIERSVVANSHPLVKGAYEVVSGRDPYFGTDAFSYTKVPVFGDLGAVGRDYNMLSDTGVTAPVDSLLRVIHNATDPTKDPTSRALESLLGANVVTVNEDDALRQQLSAYLDRNPDVASSRNLYSRSKDPETVALIRQLREAKKRLADKRKAAEKKAP